MNFNVGSICKQHGLHYGSLIKKIVQTSGNTMIECNAETRQDTLRMINSDRFKKLLQAISGGNKVKLAFAPVNHSSGEITDETVKESSGSWTMNYLEPKPPRLNGPSQEEEEKEEVRDEEGETPNQAKANLKAPSTESAIKVRGNTIVRELKTAEKKLEETTTESPQYQCGWQRVKKNVT